MAHVSTHRYNCRRRYPQGLALRLAVKACISDGHQGVLEKSLQIQAAPLRRNMSPLHGHLWSSRHLPTQPEGMSCLEMFLLEPSPPCC